MGPRLRLPCSGHTAWTKEQMKELEQALEREIGAAEQGIRQEQSQPLGPSDYRLSPELSQPAKLREKIQEGLRQLEKEDRQHYHPQEPEARRMKCDGRNRFGYNAQAVVDDQVGIITAAAVTNQENDIGQLVPMLKQAQENTGAPAGQNVADSGYGTGTDLLAVEQSPFQVVTAVVPSAGEDQPYHASQFRYDRPSNRLECPRGEKLHHERVRTRCQQQVQVFRCQNRACPVRELCSRDAKGRMVEIWDSREVLAAMRRKGASPEGQQAMKRRRETVERQFGHVKQHLGFRRWTAPGLAHARAQWAVLCLTVNLQILMKAKTR
jgi:hypothetical protein